MQHRRRDGRCINAIPRVVAENRERNAAPVTIISRTATRPRTRVMFGQHFPEEPEPDRPEIWVAIDRVRCSKHAALLGAEQAVSDNLKRQ
jgi:hypothetical protein